MGAALPSVVEGLQDRCCSLFLKAHCMPTLYDTGKTASQRLP